MSFRDCAVLHIIISYQPQVYGNLSLIAPLFRSSKGGFHSSCDVIELTDWRTKGAYRPVELEAPSSDEPLAEAPCDNLPVSDGVPESPLAPVPPPQVAEPPLIDMDPKDSKPVSKPNGDIKPLRRESKGFRIGSARRVTAGAPLTNGSLLAGDGDPDFGTPV